MNRLVENIVDRVLSNYSRSFKELYRDDYIQEASIAHWEAEKTYNRKEVPLEAYRALKIRWALGEYTRKLIKGYSQHKDYQHFSIDDLEYQTQTTAEISVPLVPVSIGDRYSEVTHTMITSEWDSDILLAQILDMVSAIEKEILYGRLLEWTDAQIAKSLGISSSTVQRQFTALSERLQEGAII
jgi:RNA polymerase sigma factor (sigma-70 family)